MVLAEDLRQAVLQAALQGKLTERLETDGDVDDLLESIQKEKEELVAQKKIKKEKALPKIQEKDVPFDIPENWRWMRWGNLAYSIQYGYNAPAKEAGKIRMVRISDIQNNSVDWGSVPYCDIEDEEIEIYLLQDNDILFARTGGTVGKSFLVNDIPENAIYAGYLIRTRYSNQLVSKYLKYFMESQLYWVQLQNGKTQGCQPNCNGQTLSKMLIPLPPIEEQQRIVDKINEIMPKIDEYEKIEKELEVLKKEFPTDMKDALLQAAMQGKLAEQLGSDSDVDELLASIKKEKEELIVQKKIKKEKSLPDIEEEEIPFDIPENWRWVRLRNVCTKIVDGDHNPPRGNVEKTEYLMLSAQNINFNKLIDLDQVRYLTKEIFEQENLRTQVQIGDIFFTIVGTLGRSCIYTGGYNISFQRSVAVISTKIYNRYLKYVLDSPYIQQYILIKATGTAQKGFYLNQVDNLLIPIPPIEEQQRIVERLDALLPLCEELKEK